MKIARSLLLVIAGALAALSAPVAVQAQNQSRVAVCDRLYSDRCASIATEGNLGVSVGPTTTATQALASTATAAVASSLSKASPSNVYSWQVTTAATGGYAMLVNATAAPADGVVTPMQCVQVAPNSTVGATFDIPERYSVGVTVLFSSTGCFTLTKSATAFIRLRAL